MSPPAWSTCAGHTALPCSVIRPRCWPWNCAGPSTNSAKWWVPSTPTTCLTASSAASAWASEFCDSAKDTAARAWPRLQDVIYQYLTPFTYLADSQPRGRPAGNSAQNSAGSDSTCPQEGSSIRVEFLAQPLVLQ